ncbi:MAG: redoxin domain-containing protein [Lentisphaeria bacterium]|nr:redoxin domain-containing protein [Lentisphaeria bacterium]
MNKLFKLTAIAVTMLFASNLQAKVKDVTFKTNAEVFKAIKRDLIKAGGRKAKVTEEMLEKRFTLVYFSAHWCPPCRAFTPKLVKWYNENQKDVNIIFVSSDSNQESMDKYMEDTKMPWVGVKKGKKSEELMIKKFRISSGIPSLVLLENGQVAKGQSKSAYGVLAEMKKKLAKKDEGEYKNDKKTNDNFKSNVDILKAIKDDLISANGEKTQVTKAMVRKRFLLVYFSAHWCPPCRAFTPKLVKWYNEDHKDYEIIFVSSDSGDEKMKAYMEETKMPWIGIKRRSDSEVLINKKFKTGGGIPNLVLIEKGKIVTSSYENGQYRGPDNAYNKMQELLKSSKKKSKSKK